MSKKYIVIIAILSIIGAYLSIELLKLHSDPSSHSAVIDSLCSPDEKSGCRAVNSSDASTMLSMPVAFWGLLFYLLVFGLSIVYLAAPEKLLLQGIFGISILALLADIYFFIYMVAALGDLCLICIFTYAATLGIVVFSFLALKEQGVGFFPDFSGLERSSAPLALPVVMLGLLVVSVSLVIFFGIHQPGKSAESKSAVMPYINYLQFAIDGFIEEHDKSAAFPMSQEHSARKGPLKVTLEVTEFADFLCPACKRAGGVLKEIFQAHPSEIAVTYRHYPLDMECNPAITRPMHVGACQLSYASYCAQVQNRFWQMHDLIFARQEQLSGQMRDVKNQKKVLTGLARELFLDTNRFLKCIDSDQAKKAIMRDINDANRMTVSSTPTIYIDGKKSGFPVPFLIEQLIEVKKSRSKK